MAGTEAVVVVGVAAPVVVVVEGSVALVPTLASVDVDEVCITSTPTLAVATLTRPVKSFFLSRNAPKSNVSSSEHGRSGF